MFRFFVVMPANAGIQKPAPGKTATGFVDSSMRWNDDFYVSRPQLRNEP